MYRIEEEGAAEAGPDGPLALFELPPAPLRVRLPRERPLRFGVVLLRRGKLNHRSDASSANFKVLAIIITTYRHVSWQPEEKRTRNECANKQAKCLIRLTLKCC